MQHKSANIVAFVILLIAIICGCWFALSQNNQNQQVVTKKITYKNVPTFFFHGWGSSYHAEEDMVNAIRNAKVTDNVIRINVTKNQKVIFHGHLKKNAKNPIIEVNFDDNKLNAYRGNYADGYKDLGAKYVKAAIIAVNEKYHYKNINIVAHSMGNLETAYYFEQYPNLQKKYPVDHFISIAGHYDGIIGENDSQNRLKLNAKTGKPNIIQPEYRGLLPLRQTFPRNTRVLNIFGNLEDGTNSDGDVSNNSAKSLKYLVAGRAKSYRNLMIKGKNAQHSKLHNNQEVNKAIINFLW
ncbi:alpha/beta hydrolase [Lactobacillus sp. PV034]|uniref:alpha/beta hydrolase n=1 Tax=Lactobacillus sp. PV034 TaxID=2594495 RepID=UPI00223FAB17|nr:alpha/beta hydrolase [Lactobacillus sp. PV034]QNQ80432.1 alpha/beta hydrolase [Lactobacillus sp. PV034]